MSKFLLAEKYMHQKTLPKNMELLLKKHKKIFKEGLKKTK
jgi:hypothetical protein